MVIIPVQAPGASALPLFLSPVYAGFPSPADDFIEQSLDLNAYLVQHPAATFCVRAKGDSMINAGIHPGALLLVDRSLDPQPNSIVLAILDGEFTVKRFRRTGDRIMLCAENPAYPSIEVVPGRDFAVWGVVTHVIRSFR